MSLLIFWSFIAYGMMTIIVYGSIFEKSREWIKSHSHFFGELVSCPLCTSTWIGFIMSLTLGSISSVYFSTFYPINVFVDGMFTAGAVWAINSIIEFFEESRIK
jgi:hypothetical protein